MDNDDNDDIIILSSDDETPIKISDAPTTSKKSRPNIDIGPKQAKKIEEIITLDEDDSPSDAKKSPVNVLKENGNCTIELESTAEEDFLSAENGHNEEDEDEIQKEKINGIIGINDEKSGANGLDAKDAKENPQQEKAGFDENKNKKDCPPSTSSAPPENSSGAAGPSSSAIASTNENEPQPHSSTSTSALEHDSPLEQIQKEWEEVENKPQSSEDELSAFMTSLRKYLAPSVLQRAKEKLNSFYNRQDLSAEDEDREGELASLIFDMRKLIKEDKTRVEYAIRQVLTTMKRNKAISFDDEGEADQLKLKKKSEKYEKYIKKLEKEVRKFDHMEVDFNSPDYEEHNTPYMIKTRLVNVYMSNWSRLCQINNCNTQTDRPIFRKVSLEAASRYPDINNAVEAYLNAKSELFAPDYFNILKIAKKTNQEKMLSLPDDEIRKVSSEIFEILIKKLKTRRNTDMNLALNFELDDPADNDPELAKKLEANKHHWGKLEEVQDEYVNKQKELNLEPEEVPSDFKTDDEDCEDENDSDIELEEDYIAYEHPPEDNEEEDSAGQNVRVSTLNNGGSGNNLNSEEVESEDIVTVSESEDSKEPEKKKAKQEK